ncbi:uncharacterized protein LOC108628158 [Ceratina calcarata]|uniref:Uncharacterized protein LOC108628158 n=1 Tax=Ceratina calcarata TaxID=156304 RepID=A0AAJ7J6L9_9HYME|nr:uncharacterized protein LOC108628158 [Ceratina calcarata]
MNTSTLKDGRSDYLQMLSAPDHAALSSPTYTNVPTSNAPDSAYLCMSPSSQKDESGIFSPGHVGTHFEFPAPTSDSEDAVEMSPMLKKSDDDPYLKPINVHERRAEFVRQMKAMKHQSDEQRPVSSDSGYANTPRNLRLIDLNEKAAKDDEKSGAVVTREHT